MAADQRISIRRDLLFFFLRVYEALAAPVDGKVKQPSDGDGAGVRVFQGGHDTHRPSRTERLCPGKAQYSGLRALRKRSIKKPRRAISAKI